MSSNQLILAFSLFDSINIIQEGAVVHGEGRSVSVEYCFFNEIITSNGGSCIDLSSSPYLFIGSSCFTRCKNTYSSDNSFANAVKFVGTFLNISRISSALCADSMDAGDSSFYGDCTDLSMSDANASSNYSPSGASSLAVRGSCIAQVTRCIDSDSAKGTTSEFVSGAQISYSIYLNTKQDKYIFNANNLELSWCIFINQSDIFCKNNLKSSDHCYTDKPRTELSLTVTESFDIHIDNIDFHQCRKNVEDKGRVCSLSGGNLKIGKMMILFLSFFDDDILPTLQSSPSPSASNPKLNPSSLSKLDSLLDKLPKIPTKEVLFG